MTGKQFSALAIGIVIVAAIWFLVGLTQQREPVTCSVINSSVRADNGIAYQQTDISCIDIAGKDVNEWIRGRFVQGTRQ